MRKASDGGGPANSRKTIRFKVNKADSYRLQFRRDQPFAANSASRDLLAALTARLADLDLFWEKEQTKAEIAVFIHDAVYANLLTSPFAAEEKAAIADAVYGHIWQQAVSGALGAAT